MPSNSRYSSLFNRLLEGELSPDETEELVAWLSKSPIDPDAEEIIARQLRSLVDKNEISPEKMASLEARLPAIFAADTNRRETPLHFLKTNWLRYAAVFIICIGTGMYFLAKDKNEGKDISQTETQNLIKDISPGGQRAILTLADGSKIVLDSAANGNLARQGNSYVTKLANGKILYDVRGGSAAVQLNTMSTPVGGQYQVTLPDGSKVWLNAASSITFPTAFTGNDRSVKISGEVYFEVAKDKHKPFNVDIDGKAIVQVLGTSFNINSYANESIMQTTLVEGSVKISKSKESVVLIPGQQAKIYVTSPAHHSTKLSQNNQPITIHSGVDINQIVAWKNGVFDFNNANLSTVMRQLERWYDIDVKYGDNVPGYIFKGKMYMNVNLSDVLEVFDRMGIKFRMTGKTLTITG